MTEKEIINGNDEICKMLGFKSTKPYIYQVPNLFPSKEDTGWTEWSVDCIGFDNDWNMLIGAHNKARQLFMQLDTSIQKMFLESDNTIVERFGFVNFFSAFENQYTISSCWNKMVDFTKWYNSLKL